MAIKEVIERLKDAGFNTPPVRRILLFCLFVYVLLIITLGYAWYADQWVPIPFHFFNDLPEWKQMDKFAHFLWAFQVSALAVRLLTWTQLKERAAMITGTIMGFLFVSSVEIGDGFSQDYGASVYDLMANALGCTAFVSQMLIWKGLKFLPKFSFHRTLFAPLRPSMLGDGWLTEILKDYNGQTFWYSAQFRFLPLPKWLTLAVGVGAEGMVYGRDHQNEAMNFSPYRKYFLSFDLNLSYLQPTSKVMKTLLYVLTIVKIPSPTLEFSSRGIRFHPLYF